jgi:virginiamycin A acetyltransferase
VSARGSAIDSVAKRFTSRRTASRGRKSPHVGEGVFLAPGSRLTSRTAIGRFTRIHGNAEFRGAASITVGQFCAIGQELLAISQNHRMSLPNIQDQLHRTLAAERGLSPSAIFDAKPIVVGNAVWVGDRVTLLSGSTIGDGAVVGAGAVVTGGLPPFAIAAGVPARVLRMRFSSSIVEFLLSVAWWDWPIDKIHRNAVFLTTDLADLDVGQAAALIVD